MEEKSSVPTAVGELTSSEAACSYTVSLSKDGNLSFDTSGDAVGLVQLLGLHQFAAHKIKQILDHNQGTGDFLIQRAAESLYQALVQKLHTEENSGSEKGASNR